MAYHLFTFEFKEIINYYAPCHKHEYQRLPMDLYNHPDILQEKLSELMADLEFVRTLYWWSHFSHQRYLEKSLRSIENSLIKIREYKS